MLGRRSITRTRIHILGLDEMGLHWKSETATVWCEEAGDATRRPRKLLSHIRLVLDGSLIRCRRTVLIRRYIRRSDDIYKV